MRNSSSAAAVITASGDEIPHLSPGIQCDDEDFGPAERELEATRQLIWEKLVARLRTEFSAESR